MRIQNAVALVTGANRGLGLEFTRQLLDRGAGRVYATARSEEGVDAIARHWPTDAVRPLRVDVTDPSTVAAAAEVARDVSLLINNAGITSNTPLVSGDISVMRAEFETHYWGSVHTTRAFAPILAAQGGGAIINVLSLLSFRAFLGSGAYAAAKAAQWQLTNSARLELAGQGTQVLGVHLGATDTDMMAGWDIPKNTPAEAVGWTLEGLESGSSEVLDPASAAVKARLNLPLEELYRA